MSGKIKITAPNTLGVRLLPKILDAYSKKHPQVEVQVILDDHYLDFNQDEIDLAIRVLKPVDSGLIAKKLSDNPVSFYVSPKYFKKNISPKTIDELKNHKVYCLKVHLNLKFKKSSQSLKELISPSRISCTNGDLLNELAFLGDGILVRSDWGVQKEVESGKLIKLALDDHLINESEIYLVYPKHKFTHPRIKAMIETIIHHQ